jgi:hypothetical protein
LIEGLFASLVVEPVAWRRVFKVIRLSGHITLLA